MLKINKTEEPGFFQKFKKKESPENWNDFTPDIKNQLKVYMLKEEQKFSNKSYCPYCELGISEKDSQIEHIKPRSKFPKLFSEYKNLITGCINNKTCGQSKENQWSDLFINPVIEDPEKYFTYDIKTGDIIPLETIGKQHEKAIKTAEILNLNEIRLRKSRRRFILQVQKTIHKMRLEEKKEYIDYFENFPTLRKFLLENVNFL